jgi:hypothetical protein
MLYQIYIKGEGSKSTLKKLRDIIVSTVAGRRGTTHYEPPKTCVVGKNNGFEFNHKIMIIKFKIRDIVRLRRLMQTTEWGQNQP